MNDDIITNHYLLKSPVLVTGANGFLARHLIYKLESHGIEVVKLGGKSQCDLRNYSFLDKYLNRTMTFSHIFHCANATKAGDWCLTHKAEQWLDNTAINLNMLRLWKERFAKAKFITFGTSCQYQSDLQEKTEDKCLIGEPDKDLYVYAQTKRHMLIGLQSLAHQYPEMKYMYFIPNTLYGTEFEESDSHFIFDIIKKVYKAKKTGEPPVLWGDGTQRRELVHVDDAVNMIFHNLYRDNEEINVSYGYDIEIRTYAYYVCMFMDYDFNNIVWDTTKFVGAKSKFLIPKEDVITSIKITPPVDGIQQVVEWYIKKHE